jgi:hypothetical protein
MLTTLSSLQVVRGTDVPLLSFSLLDCTSQFTQMVYLNTLIPSSDLPTSYQLLSSRKEQGTLPNHKYAPVWPRSSLSCQDMGCHCTTDSNLPLVLRRHYHQHVYGSERSIVACLI